MERMEEEQVPLLKFASEIEEKDCPVIIKKGDSYLHTLPDDILVALARYAPIGHDTAALVPLSIANVDESNARKILKWYVATRAQEPHRFFNAIEGSAKKKRALQSAMVDYKNMQKNLIQALVYQDGSLLKEKLSLHIDPAHVLIEINTHTVSEDRKHELYIAQQFSKCLVNNIKKEIAQKAERASIWKSRLHGTRCFSGVVLSISSVALFFTSLLMQAYHHPPYLDCSGDSVFNTTDCIEFHPTFYTCNNTDFWLQKTCCWQRAVAACRLVNDIYDNQWYKEHPAIYVWMPLLITLPTLVALLATCDVFIEKYCVKANTVPNAVKKELTDYDNTLTDLENQLVAASEDIQGLDAV